MKINLKKSEIILFIMDFLKSENLYKTLVSIESESGISMNDYNREISFLRQLILDGHWNDAEEFIKPLKEHPKFEYSNCIFEIRKQKFLEMVEVEPESNTNNVEDLVEQLKDLQTRCDQTVFSQLVFCLSSPSITEFAEYKNWTPISGRLKCFDKLRTYLDLIYPVFKEESKIAPGTFKNTLKHLITKKIISDNKNTFNTNSHIRVSLIHDDFTLGEPNDTDLIVEDDLKSEKKVKDDNELIGTNSNLKAIRNEKISQSLQVNKISELEDNYTVNKQDEDQEEFNEEESKRSLYRIQEEEKTNQRSTNKYEHYSPKFIKEEYSHDDHIEEENEEDLKTSFKNENIKSVSNIKLPEKLKISSEYDYNQFRNMQDEEDAENANNLSDLDKEEYYMKSCYEFYDYDICTLTERKVITDSHPIRTSCFSPKGDYFSVGTNSKSVKIFQIKPALNRFNKKNSYNFKEINTSSELDDIKLVFEQKNHHMGSIYCLDWSVSGRLIASGSNDKVVKLMVVPDLEESYVSREQETLELKIYGHKGTIRAVSFEPTSDLVLLTAGTIDKNIKVWDTEKGDNISNLEGHTGDIYTLKWSNDALICGSSGIDKTIRFWDLRDYKATSLISALKYSDINDISIYTKNKNMASTYIAAGHTNGMITIWDYNKKNIVKELFEHSDEVRSVSFSPDGKYLSSAGFDSKIKLFDVENNFSLIGELEHNDRVVSVKWHPEVPLLISTSADKTARLWMPDT